MIRFSRFIWLYATISGLAVGAAVLGLARYGLRPSIDFTGGTLFEVVAPEGLPQAGLETASITASGDDTYILRMREESTATLAGVQVLREERVGPVLGAELLRKASIAAVLAVVAILLYIAYAFRNLKFGVSAIVALVHDVLVVAGAFALLGRFWQVEVDTLFVTAVLTTMSFSVHDTIVVFDRIREHAKSDHKTPFAELADRALSETMNRSLTNSMTIIFMLFALLLMGGDTIRWFVAALLIGTVSGTYSSPFVATPILTLWDRWEKRKAQAR